MHQNLTIGRRVGTVATAAMAVAAVLTPVASANADSAPVSAKTSVDAQARELTPAKYTAYLKQQNDPEAKEILGTFDRMPKAKQTKFVNYLQDGKVFEAFVNSGQAGARNGARSGTHNGAEGRSVTHYNADITFVNEITMDRGENRGKRSSRLAHWNEKVTYTARQTVMGVTVTKFQIWVSYRCTRPRVDKVYSSGSALKNYNVGVSIDDKDSRPWVSGGKAHAQTIWKGSLVYKGFGVRIDKKQTLSADYEGKGKGNLKNI